MTWCLSWFYFFDFLSRLCILFLSCFSLVFFVILMFFFLSCWWRFDLFDVMFSDLIFWLLSCDSLKKEFFLTLYFSFLSFDFVFVLLVFYYELLVYSIHDELNLKFVVISSFDFDFFFSFDFVMLSSTWSCCHRSLLLSFNLQLIQVIVAFIQSN